MALTTLTGTATTSAKIGDVNTLIGQISGELSGLEDRIVNRLVALEQTSQSEHDHPTLEERIAALEALIVRSPAENPLPATALTERPGRPTDLNPDEVTLIYDRAVLYYHDIVMYADRVGENRWRLYATMNFIVISPAVWTYDEIFEGTPEAVYEHAMRRMHELAELKPAHDAVHTRVREMSEGQP